jgi:hypothetical protein
MESDYTALESRWQETDVARGALDKSERDRRPDLALAMLFCREVEKLPGSGQRHFKEVIGNNSNVSTQLVHNSLYFESSSGSGPCLEYSVVNEADGNPMPCEMVAQVRFWSGGCKRASRKASRLAGVDVGTAFLKR